MVKKYRIVEIKQGVSEPMYQLEEYRRRWFELKGRWYDKSTKGVRFTCLSRFAGVKEELTRKMSGDKIQKKVIYSSDKGYKIKNIINDKPHQKNCLLVGYSERLTDRTYLEDKTITKTRPVFSIGKDIDNIIEVNGYYEDSKRGIYYDLSMDKEELLGFTEYLRGVEIEDCTKIDFDFLATIFWEYKWSK